MYMHPALKAAGSFTGVLLLTFLCVWGARELGALGLDWGYYLTEAAIGQPDGDQQYWGAALLQVFVFPAIAAGFAGGGLTALAGGKFRWHAALLTALSVMVALICEGNLLDSEVVLGWSGMVLLYALTSTPVTWFFKEMAKRNRAKNLLLACVPALALAAVLPQTDLSKSWMIELPIYCEMVILTGILGAIGLRSKNYKMASGAATVAVLPITAFNVANVIFASVCIAIPSIGIGWHALASALTISAVTIGCAEIGGLLGLAFMRLKGDADRPLRTATGTNFKALKRTTEEVDGGVILKTAGKQRISE
jgi:hypothetical protein